MKSKTIVISMVSALIGGLITYFGKKKMDEAGNANNKDNDEDDANRCCSCEEIKENTEDEDQNIKNEAFANDISRRTRKYLTTVLPGVDNTSTVELCDLDSVQCIANPDYQYRFYTLKNIKIAKFHYEKEFCVYEETKNTPKKKVYLQAVTLVDEKGYSTNVNIITDASVIRNHILTFASCKNKFFSFNFCRCPSEVIPDVGYSIIIFDIFTAEDARIKEQWEEDISALQNAIATINTKGISKNALRSHKVEITEKMSDIKELLESI